MFQIAKSVAIVVLLNLLAACAGPVPRIDAAPATLSNIQSVAVIRPPEAKTYAVMNFGHPGMAFGLLGGLAAAGDMSSKQDQLTEALKKQNLAVSSALAENLVARLNQLGYRARLEEGPWEEREGKFTLAFDKIQSDADSVLVISPTIIGFIATGVTSDYLPTITVVAAILDKPRKNQLYRGFHASGWEPKAEGWRHTQAKTTFANFDALIADPERTAASLVEAASAVASSISADLKR